MTTKSQKKLEREAQRREAQRQHENAMLATKEHEELVAVGAAEPLTEAQKATMERIEEANKMIAKLRDWGLYYTINSDRTADREPCLCGCGQFPAGKKSVYCPGHDAKHKAAISGPKQPTICSCGCEGVTKGGKWLPGHDAKFHAAQKKAAKEAAAKVEAPAA